MKKLIRKFKQYLGITKLQEEVSMLKKDSKAFNNEINRLRIELRSVREDNHLILGHINFLNSQFFVTADISPSKYDPSVILIIKRAGRQIIKSYVFNDRSMEEIHRILEGFGEINVKYDQPLGYNRPKFRY